jgi:uncharacterized protein YutE (UPF0331/DUF86 family)
MPLDISHLKQRIIEVFDAKSELKRLTNKTYSQLSLEEKYAIRYQVIVLAEALGSISLYIATEDFKLKPQSYAECFKIMEERNVCANCSEDLTAIVRLRNLLTHRYWSIDDRQVYDSIKDNFKGVDKFIGNVREKYAINL